MPRSIRLEHPGAFYHVMARGNRREAIFVVASALAAGLQLNGSYCVVLNGAIPAQCFDPSPSLVQMARVQTVTIPNLGAVNYNAWAGGDLSDDILAVLNSLAYRNRVANVGSTIVANFFLTNDSATKDAWEANQWGAGDAAPLVDSKPIDDYEYVANTSLNFNPWGPGIRAVTDPHEAMAMANQSMTKAVGAEGGTGGTVHRSVDLNGTGMLFDTEHEAAFKFRLNRTWVFYGRLLEELGETPTP